MGHIKMEAEKRQREKEKKQLLMIAYTRAYTTIRNIYYSGYDSNFKSDLKMQSDNIIFSQPISTDFDDFNFRVFSLNVAQK